MNETDRRQVGSQMILGPAKTHFDEDAQRAKQLVKHASGLPAGCVKDDIFRSAWMLAVGASDAYFCDAYADLIARTLRAKDQEPAIELPERLGNLQVPVTAVIRKAGGWRWRMAARRLIERQSVLSLSEIKTLFNQFFPQSRKLVHESTIEPWILHMDSNQRLWGISKTAYRALGNKEEKRACKAAVDKFEERMASIFQRRHDCIHNCDRPKSAVQAIRKTSVEKAIQDIEFLVNRFHEEFVTEFPRYLTARGFSAVTRNAVT